MTESIQNVHAQTLFILAGDDLSTLQYPLPSAIFGFHVQQAREKFFKALLSAKNIKHMRTHSLHQLNGQLSDAGETIPALPFSLATLEDFSVELRYDMGDPLSDEQRGDIVRGCQVLQAFVVESHP